ncbi:DUF3558 domain-containing protein [Actinokineospora bangkokensis]|nr:DUF3558 domain-containing protein [Actinokineospora bangkokensis]
MVLAAACTSGEAGQPVPGEVGAAPSASGSAPVDLVDLDPCALVTPSIRSRLGVRGEADEGGTASARSCQWTVERGSARDSYVLGVAVFPTLGLDEVSASGGVADVEIGGRRALRSLRLNGTVCAISLELTATSRVDVQANSATQRDGALLCPRAEEAAGLIEAELP